MRLLVAVLMLVYSIPVSAKTRECRGVSSKISDRLGTFTTKGLEGRILGDLYIAYTGVRGRVPSKVTVDPVRQLDSLWVVKIACYKEAAIVRTIHHELISDYRKNRTHVTLNEFISAAETEVRLVRNSIQWKEMGSLYHMTEHELSLVKKLTYQISGEDLVAYGMTEIMPSADGDLNIQVLDFLVRNYGPEFVYAIPAVNDRYASFGFYQFTSKAVYDSDGRIEGASMVSRSLSKGRIPKSVANIRGALQHRAAYLFAIHNIAVMVKGLSGNEFATLQRLPERNHDDLIQFVAAAHNGPAHARRAARRWLDAKMKYDFFVSVSNTAVKRYAIKTKANLLALRKASH